MDAKQVGCRIALARKKRGMTLKGLGFAVDVHHSQISRMERGEVRLVGKNMQKICTFLGLDPLEESAAAPAGALIARAEALLHEWPESEAVLKAMMDALEMALDRKRKKRLGA
ncbi:helix-turn-helix protein [compost metagenome]